MNESIWIVTGHTGEYSDAREWIVCAFKTEAEAAEHVRLAQLEADKIDALRESRYSSGAANKYDPIMSMDYTGTYYRMEMCEIGFKLKE